MIEHWQTRGDGPLKPVNVVQTGMQQPKVAVAVENGAYYCFSVDRHTLRIHSFEGSNELASAPLQLNAPVDEMLVAEDLSRVLLRTETEDLHIITLARPNGGWSASQAQGDGHLTHVTSMCEVGKNRFLLGSRDGKLKFLEPGADWVDTLMPDLVEALQWDQRNFAVALSGGRLYTIPCGDEPNLAATEPARSLCKVSTGEDNCGERVFKFCCTTAGCNLRALTIADDRAIRLWEMDDHHLLQERAALFSPADLSACWIAADGQQIAIGDISGRVRGLMVNSTPVERSPLSYDVFLSYNSNDLDIVSQVCEKLRMDEGKSVFQDRLELQLGDPIYLRIIDAIRQSSLMCVFAGQVMKDWQKEEINQAKAILNNTNNNKRRPVIVGVSLTPFEENDLLKTYLPGNLNMAIPNNDVSQIRTVVEAIVKQLDSLNDSK